MTMQVNRLCLFACIFAMQTTQRDIATEGCPKSERHCHLAWRISHFHGDLSAIKKAVPKRTASFVNLLNIYCLATLIASISFGTTSNKSPTTP